MPDIYKLGEYDLVGFAVGIVEKSDIITGKDIKAGDVLIGIKSSGLHSNGYTLVRKLAEVNNVSYDQHIDQLGKTLGEELLTPTKIYAKLIEKLTSSFSIKGIANITGGGWVENIPRMLAADDLKLRVFKDNAPSHEIFKLLQKWGNVDELEMYSTFNMGIGLVVCVDNGDAEAVLKTIRDTGEEAYQIGVVESREEGEANIVIV